MSKPIPAELVKLIFSVFATASAKINETIALLVERYGRLDFVSAEMPFDYTGYYGAEMGSNLVRRFMSAEELLKPDDLPDVKLAANDLEKEFMAAGCRLVNVDPGYISKSHLILATGKGYAHRPYLRDGIYADLTLIYQAGKFCPLPWTYPDYADEKQILMFGKIRARYLLQLKAVRQ